MEPQYHCLGFQIYDGNDNDDNTNSRRNCGTLKIWHRKCGHFGEGLFIRWQLIFAQNAELFYFFDVWLSAPIYIVLS